MHFYKASRGNNSTNNIPTVPKSRDLVAGLGKDLGTGEEFGEQTHVAQVMASNVHEYDAKCNPIPQLKHTIGTCYISIWLYIFTENQLFTTVTYHRKVNAVPQHRPGETWRHMLARSLYCMWNSETILEGKL